MSFITFITRFLVSISKRGDLPIASLVMVSIVMMVIPLPTADDGMVWPVDDPSAETVELIRATPSILDSANMAPDQRTTN